jgi:hypothetical protein
MLPSARVMVRNGPNGSQPPIDENSNWEGAFRVPAFVR